MKKNLRGRIVFVLILTMVFSLFGCQTQTTKKGNASFATGTYTGTAMGKLGPITVEVTFDEDQIQNVEVVSQNETEALAEIPIERIPSSVVEYQSLAVDTISGATLSSLGIINAIKDCVTQAGEDPQNLMVEIPSTAGEDEEYTVDVCVVGAGGAGTAAAVQSARDGAKVILLEKSAIPGGLGAQGAGLAAVESKLQKEAGLTFTTDDVFDHMFRYTNSTVYAPLLRTIVDNSAETIDWLSEDFGWDFDLITPNIWGSEAYDTYHLNTTFGKERMDPFYEDLEKNGGALMLETAGEKIIIENGKITGVEAKKTDGTVVRVYAKSVVLATGGAIANDEILYEYTNTSNYEQMGWTISTGDGIRMAQEVGAALTNEIFLETSEIGMTEKVAPNTKFNINLIPSAALLHVNNVGVRYFNEQLFREEPLNNGGAAVAANGEYYVIFDQTTMDTLTEKGFVGLLTEQEAKKQQAQFEKLSHFGVVGGVPPMFAGIATPLDNLPYELETAIADGYAWKADSVEALAEETNLPELIATVEKYIGYVDEGKDEEFLKDEKYLTPINEGPYYAVRYIPGVFNTLGGVVINEDIQALNTENEPIEGLYVAGVDGGSMFHEPYYDICGTTMMYAYTSGRLAGENAAVFALEQN
ncbi:MAG: FAD-dependent oxidoreductase [Eubacteriaceae bacterium]